MIAQFHTPEFYGLIRQYEVLKRIKENYPEVFLNDREIFTVYGSFPNMIWNGGRAMIGNQISINEVDEVFDFYINYLKIIPSLTMTNLLLQEKHCYDTFCNLVMELAVKYDCIIMTANDVLEQYIKQNYPTLRLIRSVCKAANENIPYDISDKYFLSVLDRKYNNTEMIDNIPLDKRNKIEILCNDTCYSFCSNYSCHHKYESKKQLYLVDMKNDFNCKNPTDFPFYSSTLYNGYISSSMINGYMDKGYFHFKVVGRDGTFNAIYSLVEYLIHQEYRIDMINHLLGEI